MRLAAMQPYFFPYIGYFQLINAADRFILYSDIDYIRHGWINRNRIKQKGYSFIYITVPVHMKRQIRIKDVYIDETTPRWHYKIIQSIRLNYRQSPYFDEIFPLIEQGLSGGSPCSIAVLNETSIRIIADYLDIRTEIFSDIGRYPGLENTLSRMDTDGYKDLSRYKEKQVARIQVRPLEFCRLEGADTYINPIGGTKLYDKKLFLHYGVNLQFVQTDAIQYPQKEKPFIPNLSIIDVLMQNGKEKTKELLSCYTLI